MPTWRTLPIWRICTEWDSIFRGRRYRTNWLVRWQLPVDVREETNSPFSFSCARFALVERGVPPNPFASFDVDCCCVSISWRMPTKRTTGDCITRGKSGSLASRTGPTRRDFQCMKKLPCVCGSSSYSSCCC